MKGLAIVAAVSLLTSTTVLEAGQGGRGAAATARESAAIDLTGYWVSVVVEDWKWRMVTPNKGVYEAIPLSPAGRKVADGWDPARDEAAGEQCRSYGAANIMRVPGRLRISWQDENVLRIDTDAGTQARRFQFGTAPPPRQPSWQGHSSARWEYGPGRGQGRMGSLKVVTTNLRPGYLRKNGVPYSGSTTVTEYYDINTLPNGDRWMTVTTRVDDPQYLARHSPAYAPHSWTGFSTGEWIGNTLKVTTTHLKDGFLRRGGPQTTDMYAMTEFITRHDDILTIVTVIDDPLYQDQPYVHSTTYTADLNNRVNMETCNGSFAENGGTDRHHVPHFLPGENADALTEWITKGGLITGGARNVAIAEDWVPLAAARGGVKTLYPEYRSTLNGGVSVEALAVPASRSTISAEKLIAAQSPRDGDVHILPVQGNVYMLVADGTNVTASLGPDGVTLVNTGSAQMSDKVLAAVAQLARSVATPVAPNACSGPSCPGMWGWSSPYINSVITSPPPAPPIRYVINTSGAPEYSGGNEKIATAGSNTRSGGFGAAVETVEGAAVLAHENVLTRLSTPAGNATPPPAAALPTVTYFDEFYKLPAYFNGEAVIVYHAPEATTDGDSYVYFRRSEVISAGDLFSTVSYPVIDVARGGSVQGVIRGLNAILDLAVAEYRSQGGTWIIPSHGRLSDTADVASYRNMLVIIRDRVQDLIEKGMTLEQVKAARPSLDFDGRYGSVTGPWTTDMFIEAVYRSLQDRN